MIPIILNIDTALDKTIISLGEGNKILAFVINDEQNTNASILHPAIRDLFINCHLKPKNLSAISVTIGPGSYTGLRVGLAAAKGFCYALKIPLICINTLELMVLNVIREEDFGEKVYCPMIDARRMEVYTALYKKNLEELMSPRAIILDAHSLEIELQKWEIIFFGSGSSKFKTLGNNKFARFINLDMNPGTMVTQSFNKFNKSDYSYHYDIQPLYIKEFFTIKPTYKR